MKGKEVDKLREKKKKKSKRERVKSGGGGTEQNGWSLIPFTCSFLSFFVLARKLSDPATTVPKRLGERVRIARAHGTFEGA